MKSTDISGQRFGRLVAIRDCGSEGGERLWLCKCDCGRESKTTAYRLTSGNTTSCGCKRREASVRNGKANKIHGMKGTGTGSSWQAMITRCYNKKQVIYKWYGAKGITACEYLRSSPLNLKALLGMRPDKMTLDRINNDFGYCCGMCRECVQNEWPLNVRWADRITQARNKKTAVFLTIEGETKHVIEWAKIYGLSAHMLRKRICLGKSLPEILAPRGAGRLKQCCPKCGGDYSLNSQGHHICKPCMSVYQAARYAAKKAKSK